MAAAPRRRLIFVNRFYWPDEPATAQLLTDLAEALAASEHDILIISSRAGEVVPSREYRHGVDIYRVRGTRWSRFGLLGKATDFATFYIGAVIRLLWLARRHDQIVALTDPPLIGIGVWLAARLRGANILHWAQDIYPDIAITLTGHRWLSAIAPLRDIAWRRADACVTLGYDMAKAFQTAGVPRDKITVIPNWAPAGLSAQSLPSADALRSAWGLNEKFVVLYSGNLGRVHDLEPLIDLAEHLRAETNIAILVIGFGAQRAELVAEVARRRLTNFHFQPPQPRAQLAQSLAVGNLHLVTLRPGCERSVFPSKLYGIAAIGRPVLFIGPHDCEIAHLIGLHRFGCNFTRDSIPAMAATVVKLRANPEECGRMGTAATRFADSSGDVQVAARRWAALAVKISSR